MRLIPITRPYVIGRVLSGKKGFTERADCHLLPLAPPLPALFVAMEMKAR